MTVQEARQARHQPLTGERRRNVKAQRHCGLIGRNRQPTAHLLETPLNMIQQHGALRRQRRVTRTAGEQRYPCCNFQFAYCMADCA
ncbi:hypothetical protein D3C79_715080 [compost metagenome]